MAFHIDITRVERIKNRIDNKSEFSASNNIITVFLRDSVSFQNFIAINGGVCRQCYQCHTLIKRDRMI